MTTFEPIRIWLAGPPVPKGRPRLGRYGNVFTPKRTASYEAALRGQASNVMNGRPPLNCAVELEVTAYMPIPASWSRTNKEGALCGYLRPAGRPDLDNIVKAATDGCNGVIFTDDARIVTIHASKRYSATPGVAVTVRPVATPVLPPSPIPGHP